VLIRVLGKRATGIYLAAIAICAVGFGLLVDQIYAIVGVSAQAMVGQAGEAIPHAVELAGAILILALSVKPVWRFMRRRIFKRRPTDGSVRTDTTTVKAPEPCAGST
ncbi:MAG: hypothetical protein V2I40_09465, partial [Desulfobacteraceae bacterium]|jgi:hypothetical protein|nr:hypothetical protein [Desulfobacteraceae bacterium]